MIMKTNSKAFVWAFSLLGLALMAASCEKYGGGGSRYVRFRAMVQSAAGGVRTEYSGVVDDFGFERIDWSSEDKIRIYSDFATNPDDGGNKFADYTISGATSSETTTDNKKRYYSVATVTADKGYGLVYDEDETHRFWGIYPSHALSVSGTGSSATASGLTVSSTQNVSDSRKTEVADAGTGAVTSVTYAPDMSQAWMLAEQSGVTGNADFDLLFYPAFTAFEFTLQSQFEKELTVKSFTLSSATTALAGDFDATVLSGGSSTYDCPDASTGSKTIGVSFGEGVTVTQTKSLTFTVLALPQEIRKLTIDFLINVNGADIHRTLALTNSSSSFSSKDEDDYIIFLERRKYKITGLALPSGDLQMSIDVNDWVVGADEYEYVSAVNATLQCYAGDSYRRYTANSKDYVAVSFGYRNDSGEVIITDDPAGYQNTENTALRSAFSPILELTTTSDPSAVLELQLDNPNFKFIQYASYANDSSTIDFSRTDHTRADHLDVVSGPEVKTFFSVVPVKQFSTNTVASEMICKVTLLSVDSGSLREITFNQLNDTQSLPGESKEEIKFMYFNPADYDEVGTLVTATSVNP